jgi:hypothetical protein
LGVDFIHIPGIRLGSGEIEYGFLPYLSWFFDAIAVFVLFRVNHRVATRVLSRGPPAV